MNAGILILAAGSATRFGSDKRLADLPDGRLVIDALLDNVRSTGLPFLVCLAERDDELAIRLRGKHAPVVQCIRSGEGMGATLAEGIRHIPDWDGVLVALADMPWIRPDTYRVMAAHLSHDTICVPVYHGHRGHPVGFGSDFYGELVSLGGDIGARGLIQRFEDRVVNLPVNDSAIERDIDVPSDMEWRQ